MTKPTNSELERAVRKLLSKTIVVREAKVMPEPRWVDDVTDKFLALISAELKKQRDEIRSGLIDKKHSAYIEDGFEEVTEFLTVDQITKILDELDKLTKKGK